MLQTQANQNIINFQHTRKLIYFKVIIIKNNYKIYSNNIFLFDGKITTSRERNEKKINKSKFEKNVFFLTFCFLKNSYFYIFFLYCFFI